VARLCRAGDAEEDAAVAAGDVALLNGEDEVGVVFGNAKVAAALAAGQVKDAFFDRPYIFFFRGVTAAAAGLAM